MSMTKGWSHRPLRSGFPSAVRGISAAADMLTSGKAIATTRAAWDKELRTVNLQMGRTHSNWLKSGKSSELAFDGYVNFCPSTFANGVMACGCALVALRISNTETPRTNQRVRDQR